MSDLATRSPVTGEPSSASTDGAAGQRGCLRPPRLGSVQMGGFWADRIEATRARTVPILFQRCEEAGMFDQIDPRRPVPEQRIPFSTAFGGSTVRPVGGNVTAQMYWDSDVAKVIEIRSRLSRRPPRRGHGGARRRDRRDVRGAAGAGRLPEQLVHPHAARQALDQPAGLPRALLRGPPHGGRRRLLRGHRQAASSST